MAIVDKLANYVSEILRKNLQNVYLSKKKPISVFAFSTLSEP